MFLYGIGPAVAGTTDGTVVDPRAATVRSLIESMISGPDRDPGFAIGGGNQSDSGGDIAKQVQDLISHLQPPTVREPTQYGAGHKILGAIGDAISAYSHVLAHQAVPPYGPFAETQREEQRRYEAESLAAQERTMQLRNALTIGLLGEEGKRRVAQTQAGGRAAAAQAAAQSREKAASIGAEGRTKAAEIGAQSREKAAAAKPHATQLVKNAQGQMEPVDRETGLSLWTGKPVRTAAPAGMMGVNQNLDEGERLIQELTTNYMAGPGHVDAGTGQFVFGPGDMEKRATATAAANFTKEGTLGKKLGLSGYAGQYDPHAVVHQRDLDLLPVSLAFPLSMTRRAVEGPMKAIRGALPDYTDPPPVWQTFTRQMQDIIGIARTLPWDSDPEGSANRYQAALMKAAAVTAQAKDAAKAPPAGAISPELQDYLKRRGHKVQ